MRFCCSCMLWLLLLSICFHCGSCVCSLCVCIGALGWLLGVFLVAAGVCIGLVGLLWFLWLGVWCGVFISLVYCVCVCLPRFECLLASWLCEVCCRWSFCFLGRLFFVVWW